MDPRILVLDVGGSSVKSALVETDPKIPVPVSIDPIASQASAAEILTTLAAVIAGHLENSRDINKIAFAFPGPIDYDQGIPLL